jgi:hypothetical protein
MAFLSTTSGISQPILSTINAQLYAHLFGRRLHLALCRFKIDAAEKDLKYKPIIPFKKGWADTIVWFRENWLPK